MPGEEPIDHGPDAGPGAAPYVAAVACAGLALGGLGPWQVTLGEFETDAEGGLVVAAAVAGMLLLALQSALGRARWPSVLLALAGVVGAGVAVAEILDLLALAPEGGDAFGTDARPGWGLFVSLLAGLALAATAGVLVVRRPFAPPELRRRSAPGARGRGPGRPAAGYPTGDDPDTIPVTAPPRRRRRDPRW